MLSVQETIAYSTARIETYDSSGKLIGTGSSFFLDLNESDNDNEVIPVIVTNKHVVSGGAIFRILVCTMDANGNPQDNSHVTIDIHASNAAWQDHPDPDVDLCAQAIAPYINTLSERGVKLFIRVIPLKFIPKADEILSIDSAEDITMVGYPIGLWDTVNNKPIFRKGITATHFAKDYCGKKEFLIDCACFPGSSGSPVFIMQTGMHAVKNGGGRLGNRLHLLGVLYAGPQFTANGSLQVVNIPTAQTAIIQSSIPSNLGVVIKSEMLMDFKQVFGV